MRADLSAILKNSKKFTGEQKVHADFVMKSFDEDEHIVYGQVYAPYVLDSHFEMMLPADVKKLAHRFLLTSKNQQIDVMHNNKRIKASIVESYIAKAGDDQYDEGAWALATYIEDPIVWEAIKAGKLNGYSLEAYVYKEEAEVIYDYIALHFGLTEENDGHFHAFYVEVDETGKVTGGSTGPGGDDNHSHKIKAGTATQLSNEHAHRYFLNEIDDEG
jgi:hypothetical protein